MGGQPPRETAGKHSMPKLVGRPLERLTEPRAGAQQAAAAIAEELQAPQAKAVRRRNRRTCCSPETSYDISGIPFATAVQHSAGRREGSPPGGVSRNARTLSRLRGSHFRSSRRGYSEQFLRSLFRWTCLFFRRTEASCR